MAWLADSFPMLIGRLEATHPRGITGLSHDTGISYQTLWRWTQPYGAKMPEYHLLARLAKGCRLPVDDVVALAQRDWARYQKGEVIPVPKIKRKRGPSPRVAAILLTLATAAGVYFADSPPAVAQTIDNVRLITPPRRRQWGWFRQWTLALA